MGWLIAAGVLILLAILPLGVSIKYDSEGPRIYAAIGPIRYKVFPGKKKENKPEAEKTEKAQKENKTSGKKEGSQRTGGKLSDLLPLVRLALDFLVTFRKKLRVNWLELKLIMAADDPCDLAVNYGRAWTAVGNLLPRLEKLFVIKKRNIEVECDFEAAQTRVIARLDLTITLGRLLATVLVYGGKAGLEFMKINKKRKGGAS
jgi:hypothetical protein